MTRRISTVNTKRGLFPLAGLILSLFTVISVFCSIIAAAKGAEILGYESQIGKIEQENREISGSLVTKNSLKELAEIAPQFNLGSNSQVIYLNSTVSVAQLR